MQTVLNRFTVFKVNLRKHLFYSFDSAAYFFELKRKIIKSFGMINLKGLLWGVNISQFVANYDIIVSFYAHQSPCINI